MLSRGGRDARDLVLFGYARLVAWDEDLALVPDILVSIAVEEERIFTLALRPVHRCSAGQPFTTEDFRSWWEDVANNVEINPRDRKSTRLNSSHLCATRIPSSAGKTKRTM